MMNIYWLDSLDHGEDWFVAANNMREAMAFFADDMGYDLVEDEVRATEVCAVPEEVTIAQAQFLDEDQITACGGKFIHYDDKDLLVLVDQALLDSLGVETRIVRFDYQVFIEGNVARAALQTLKSQFLL
jgi:hypothetical protein